MTIAHLVESYGYVAVFVGSLLEGETVLLLAGAAAHQSYLSFPVVVAIAFCGGTLGDQLLFGLGRWRGQVILRHYPRLAKRAAAVNRLILSHQTSLIIGVRFLYGLRLIGPAVIGMSDVSTARFMVLNMVGAAVWAPLVVGIGYLFGHAASRLASDLASYEAVALLLVAGAVVVGGAIHWWLSREH